MIKKLLSIIKEGKVHSIREMAQTLKCQPGPGGTDDKRPGTQRISKGTAAGMLTTLWRLQSKSTLPA